VISPPARPVVALFNSSDDLIEMIRYMLELKGFLVASAHINDLRRGNFDLEAFVRQNQPVAVIYDLVPPFDRQWAFMDHLRQNSALRGIPFVLTSTNPALAQELASRNEPVLQVVGRPFEFEQLLAAVQHGLSGSGTVP